jgi:hypothetical protein
VKRGASRQCRVSCGLHVFVLMLDQEKQLEMFRSFVDEEGKSKERLASKEQGEDYSWQRLRVSLIEIGKVLCNALGSSKPESR